MSPTIVKGPTGRILHLREILQGITDDDVKSVLSNFSMELAKKYSFNESTDYDLVIDGNRYPPKAILGLAAQRVVGRPLTSDEFAGGDRSAAFSILRDLGFNVEPKAQSGRLILDAATPLIRYSRYSREAIARIFEPNYKFTRGSGRWGISGIVEFPKESGDFVLIVTLGPPNDGNPYQDALTQDGYLIWESQTQHSFQSQLIKKLIAHDPSANNIQLFLRSDESSDYLYMGLLEYFSHDKTKQKPVHFVWRIRNWDLNVQELQRLKLEVRPPIDPTYSVASQHPTATTLTEVPRPKTSARAHARGVRKATVREVDWAAKDAKNRRLGLAGETLVKAHEIALLNAANRPDLAIKVEHVALRDATLGYDILSFYPDGREKRIEVKTTEGSINTPFFISINEVLVSRDDPESYWIYRVFDFDQSSPVLKYYVMNGDVEACCDLDAVSFRARPRTIDDRE